jgi:hypothetical protein
MPLNPDQYVHIAVGDEPEPVDVLPRHPATEISIRALIEATQAISGGGFAIPNYDEIVLGYYPTPLKTNLHTATYKLATVTVLTVTLSYDGGGAVENDILTGVAFA